MSEYPITEESERTDYDARMLARRIDQYKARTKFGKWVSSYAYELQALESAIWEVILERLLSNAVGVQLDMLGRIVGAPRFTSDDDEYRIFVRARIAINSSQGLWSDLYQVGKLVLRAADEDADFHLEERSPATLMFFLDEPIDNDPNLAAKYLNEARSAGVRFQVIYMDLGETLASSFTWSDSNGNDTTGAGWDDANDPGTEGGSLASAVQP